MAIPIAMRGELERVPEDPERTPVKQPEIRPRRARLERREQEWWLAVVVGALVLSLLLLYAVNLFR